MSLQPGDLVRLNAAGRGVVMAKHADRLGRVMRLHRYQHDIVWVLWRGTVTVQSWSTSYLERADG